MARTNQGAKAQQEQSNGAAGQGATENQEQTAATKPDGQADNTASPAAAPKPEASRSSNQEQETVPKSSGDDPVEPVNFVFVGDADGNGPRGVPAAKCSIDVFGFNFAGGQPTAVTNARAIEKLRNNNHFNEVS